MRFSSRERSRGGWVLIALIAASFLLTTVYYREGDSGPLTSTRRVFHAVITPVSHAGAFVTSPIRAVGGWFAGLTISREEIEILREQNATLRQRVVDLEEARLENERLRGLVGLVDGREFDAVGTRIIARPLTAWEAVVTIDRGGADGVAPGMPVLTVHGLLGYVVETSERSSRVRLITDQRSGVAAMLQASRAEGVVSGSINGDLVMRFVSRDATVTVGEPVLTSGLGGVYPRGLLVGEVASYRLTDADLHPVITVRSNVSLPAIEEAVVLVGAAAEIEGGGGQ
ncbi:MAG: rod shape-determining protein MreC [Clostridiales bacterium]|nr:rod shape-determining protein MreC [Clostridiales bacterium]